MIADKLQSIHPGEILLEEFLNPLALSPQKLALGIKVDSEIIEAIIEKKQPITANYCFTLKPLF